MLTIYRRHRPDCPHNQRSKRNCKCPIWVQGTLARERIRKSLNLTSWEAAQNMIRDWEASGHLYGNAFNPTPVSTGLDSLLSDLQSRHLAITTLDKYRTLTKQLSAFAEHKGIRFIHRFSIKDLREFRAGWDESPISAQKKLERLKAIFRFFQHSKWIKDDPAVVLRPPVVEQKPTLPFTEDEMQLILKACDTYPTKNSFGFDNRARIKALVLLLRYSGLRITDAACLTSDRISDGNLFIYTQKTGVPVKLPLPPEVLEALEKIRNGTLYFWSGESKLISAGKNWQRAFRRLFKHAEILNGHPHRFRDTFAVDLLQKGVALEMVSILLGHRSIKITEKHYAPWVKARQDQLEAAIKKMWSAQPAPPVKEITVEDLEFLRDLRAKLL